LAPRAGLWRRLRKPYAPPERPREPLFVALRSAGFDVEPFNTTLESLLLRLDEVHELDRVPARVRPLLGALLSAIERRNALRLDWIAARGFTAGAGAPFALVHLLHAATPPSDHAPIGCSLKLAPGAG